MPCLFHRTILPSPATTSYALLFVIIRIIIVVVVVAVLMDTLRCSRTARSLQSRGSGRSRRLDGDSTPWLSDRLMQQAKLAKECEQHAATQVRSQIVI